MVNCSILGCKNASGMCNTTNKGITFHRFPKVPDVKEKWMNFTGRQDWFPTENSRICSVHFKEEDFNVTAKRRNLRQSSIPTLKIWKLCSENASGSSTTLSKDTPGKTEASLPEAKDIIISVYHYLQTEYENLKSYTGGSCDFSPLANILKRTAAATGVSEQTVTAVIQDSKQSEESTLDPIPSKRAKLSHDIKHECVRPIKEMSSCGSAKDAEHPDSESQVGVEEHPLETLKVEVHDYDEHQIVGGHEFWLKIEPSSTQKEPAEHQSLPPTAPTRTEVKQEPVDVEDLEQLEGGGAVEDTGSVEAPVCESAAAVRHLLSFTYDKNKPVPEYKDTEFSSVSTTQAERRPD